MRPVRRVYPSPCLVKKECSYTSTTPMCVHSWRGQGHYRYLVLQFFTACLFSQILLRQSTPLSYSWTQHYRMFCLSLILLLLQASRSLPAIRFRNAGRVYASSRHNGCPACVIQDGVFNAGLTAVQQTSFLYSGQRRRAFKRVQSNIFDNHKNETWKSCIKGKTSVNYTMKENNFQAYK